MIGLSTRAALIPLIFTMATAFFAVHLDDPFGQQEKAILFGFAFITLFFTGPGRYPWMPCRKGGRGNSTHRKEAKRG
jgi:putative oxidoreductase